MFHSNNTDCCWYIYKGWVKFHWRLWSRQKTRFKWQYINWRWQQACTSDLLAETCDDILRANIFNFQHKRQWEKEMEFCFVSQNATHFKQIIRLRLQTKTGSLKQTDHHELLWWLQPDLFKKLELQAAYSVYKQIADWYCENTPLPPNSIQLMLS